MEFAPDVKPGARVISIVSSASTKEKNLPQELCGGNCDGCTGCAGAANHLQVAEQTAERARLLAEEKKKAAEAKKAAAEQKKAEEGGDRA